MIVGFFDSHNDSVSSSTSQPKVTRVQVWSCQLSYIALSGRKHKHACHTSDVEYLSFWQAI